MPHATTNFSSQLEPMGIIFGAIRGFRNLNGSVNESYTSKRPQVGRHALNHLFRKRLDPWNYNLLLVRSQVLSDLEKPKIECIESSVVSRQFSVSARSQQNLCRHPRPVTSYILRHWSGGPFSTIFPWPPVHLSWDQDGGTYERMPLRASCRLLISD